MEVGTKLLLNDVDDYRRVTCALASGLCSEQCYTDYFFDFDNHALVRSNAALRLRVPCTTATSTTSDITDATTTDVATDATDTTATAATTTTHTSLLKFLHAPVTHRSSGDEDDANVTRTADDKADDDSDSADTSKATRAELTYKYGNTVSDGDQMSFVDKVDAVPRALTRALLSCAHTRRDNTGGSDNDVTNGDDDDNDEKDDAGNVLAVLQAYVDQHDDAVDTARHDNNDNDNNSSGGDDDANVHAKVAQLRSLLTRLYSVAARSGNVVDADDDGPKTATSPQAATATRACATPTARRSCRMTCIASYSTTRRLYALPLPSNHHTTTTTATAATSLLVRVDKTVYQSKAHYELETTPHSVTSVDDKDCLIAFLTSIGVHYTPAAKSKFVRFIVDHVSGRAPHTEVNDVKLRLVSADGYRRLRRNLLSRHAFTLHRATGNKGGGGGGGGDGEYDADVHAGDAYAGARRASSRNRMPANFASPVTATDDDSGNDDAVVGRDADDGGGDSGSDGVDYCRTHIAHTRSNNNDNNDHADDDDDDDSRENAYDDEANAINSPHAGGMYADMARRAANTAVTTSTKTTMMMMTASSSPLPCSEEVYDDYYYDGVNEELWLQQSYLRLRCFHATPPTYELVLKTQQHFAAGHQNSGTCRVELNEDVAGMLLSDTPTTFLTTQRECNTIAQTLHTQLGVHELQQTVRFCTTRLNAPWWAARAQRCARRTRSDVDAAHVRKHHDDSDSDDDDDDNDDDNTRQHLSDRQQPRHDSTTMRYTPLLSSSSASPHVHLTAATAQQRRQSTNTTAARRSSVAQRALACDALTSSTLQCFASQAAQTATSHKRRRSDAYVTPLLVHLDHTRFVPRRVTCNNKNDNNDKSSVDRDDGVWRDCTPSAQRAATPRHDARDKVVGAPTTIATTTAMTWTRCADTHQQVCHLYELEVTCIADDTSPTDVMYELVAELNAQGIEWQPGTQSKLSYYYQLTRQQRLHAPPQQRQQQQTQEPHATYLHSVHASDNNSVVPSTVYSLTA